MKHIYFKDFNGDSNDLYISRSYNTINIIRKHDQNQLSNRKLLSILNA